MAYPNDPRLREEVLSLYDSVWPTISARIRRAKELGSDWYSISTPFVLREGSAVIAHVGVAMTDLCLAGQRCSVAAVHAVCVHPDHQGRGLGRRVMESALEWIDAQGYPTTILWSEKTDFYARFGFQRVQESIFQGAAPPPRGAIGRRLDVDRPCDREELLSMLRRRRPVSSVAAAADDGWHFLIDLALWPEAASMLHLIEGETPETRAILVAEIRDRTLHLYDVVAASLPTTEQIVAGVCDVGLPPPRELVVYFTPDGLDVELTPRAPLLEDSLHVRGQPLPGTVDAEGRIRPFALSPLTRT